MFTGERILGFNYSCAGSESSLVQFIAAECLSEWFCPDGFHASDGQGRPARHSSAALRHSLEEVWKKNSGTATHAISGLCLLWLLDKKTSADFTKVAQKNLLGGTILVYQTEKQPDWGLRSGREGLPMLLPRHWKGPLLTSIRWIPLGSFAHTRGDNSPEIPSVP